MSIDPLDVLLAINDPIPFSPAVTGKEDALSEHMERRSICLVYGETVGVQETNQPARVVTMRNPMANPGAN